MLSQWELPVNTSSVESRKLPQPLPPPPPQALLVYLGVSPH